MDPGYNPANRQKIESNAENLNQFCYATVMGIVFALLIEATGSILSTMLIHFAINGFSVVMMYLYPLLYDMLKMFYQMATESGDTATAEMITSSIGDMTLTGTEWMEQTLNMTVDLRLGDVLYVYLMPAIGSGILAYWVFRTIAIRTGRWEHVRGLFGKKEGARTFMTIPLMIAIAVGVVFMFFTELLMRLPR